MGFTIDRSPVYCMHGDGDKMENAKIFTTAVNLESAVNLACMYLDCGRRPTKGEQPHATEKGLR